MNSPAPSIDELAERRLAERVAEPDDIGVSESYIAAAFINAHGWKLRYVAAWDAWMVWTGTHWERDESMRLFALARGICQSEAARLCELADSEFKRRRIRERLGGFRTITNVVNIARADVPVAVDELDADPWALNTPGGVIDLRDGSIRPHDPKELHTKIAAATPGGECPTFMRVLETALPDPYVRDYVQRLVGAALVGLVRDHVMPFAYGTGRNGKGTIVHAIRHAMGDYAAEIPTETLMESHNDRHPTEMAMLRGVRFAVGSEVDSGRNWNESRLKRLTGGDPISARYMRSDFFEFDPSHTLLIVGNHKPAIRCVDEAIRRRVHLIPFTVTIPADQVDSTLPEKLRDEAGGILAWALAGCLDWQEAGLNPPMSVVQATDEYLSAEDSIGEWVAECCNRAGCVTLKAAHASYLTWCKENSAQALGRNNFAEQLEARFPMTRDARNKTKRFGGLELKLAGLASTPYAD